MLKLLRAAILPTLSGVLYFLSWIGFGIWPLTFVCLVPLAWALRRASLKQALALGAWMGFVTHLGGYTWVIHLLTVFRVSAGRGCSDRLPTDLRRTGASVCRLRLPPALRVASDAVALGVAAFGGAWRCRIRLPALVSELHRRSADAPAASDSDR